jgi:hypothetical protein
MFVTSRAGADSYGMLQAAALTAPMSFTLQQQQVSPESVATPAEYV